MMKITLELDIDFETDDPMIEMAIGTLIDDYNFNDALKPLYDEIYQLSAELINKESDVNYN